MQHAENLFCYFSKTWEGIFDYLSHILNNFKIKENILKYDRVIIFGNKFDFKTLKKKKLSN